MENNKSPTEPRYFFKIPKEIIKETMLPEHRISLLSYLNIKKTIDNEVGYCANNIIEWCGYKTNWHRGSTDNIYNKFLLCMEWYLNNGYIENFNRNIFKSTTFQSSILNMDKLNPTTEYGIIYDFELQRILSYKSKYKPLNKSKLLLLLAYIRCFTWTRCSSSGYSVNTQKNKPEIFHSQYKTIGTFIGMSERIVSKATEVLEELDLIVTHRMPSYKLLDGSIRTDDVIYVCPYKIATINKKLKFNTDYDYKKELEYGIQYLRDGKCSRKKNNQK